MIAVLSKPADQIGVSDLNELIDSEVPESDQIEFKETLSTRDGSPDRWITHRDRIGEKARNQILEETVAFANAATTSASTTNAPHRHSGGRRNPVLSTGVVRLQVGIRKIQQQCLEE